MDELSHNTPEHQAEQKKASSQDSDSFYQASESEAERQENSSAYVAAATAQHGCKPLTVDDLQLFGPDKAKIGHLKTKLNRQFDMTDLGACSHYLGMQITRDRAQRTLRLTQRTCLNKVLCSFRMEDSKLFSSLMDQGAVLVKELAETADIADIRRY